MKKWVGLWGVLGLFFLMGCGAWIPVQKYVKELEQGDTLEIALPRYQVEKRAWGRVFITGGTLNMEWKIKVNKLLIDKPSSKQH
jgi:hypothetical protein